MSVNLDFLNFFTGVNYMKRSGLSGSYTIGSSPDVVLNHNLGFVGQFLSYIDLDNNGILWYGGERVFEGTESTAGGWTYPPIVDTWNDVNTLTLHPTGGSAGRACYWLIYLDYKGF